MMRHGLMPASRRRRALRKRSVHRAAPAAAAAALLVASCGALLACGETSAPRPNVLVYVVDTLRADGLGTYGNAEASTPNFDALAKEGVTFENAYATASWTRASMASLLTGLLPWHHGAEGRADRLPEAALTLAELFAERGYSTALISANPNVSSVFGFRQAFDELGELYARSKPGLVAGRELVTPSPVVTSEIVQWLRTAQEPFFVMALPIDPHQPHLPPPRHDPGRYRSAGTPPRRNEKGPATRQRTLASEKRSRELYQAEVAFNDESFGVLVDSLKQLGLWDDTLVVVTADHGEEFWEYGTTGHGRSLTEEVLRVPLIVRRPGDARLPAGVRTERLISLVDLPPTLLDLSGIPIPDELDGRSFFSRRDPAAPLLAGLQLDGRNLLTAIEGDYKLVWDRGTNRRHLYDLRGDHAEARPIDVAGNAEAAAAVERLSAAIDASLAADQRTLEKSTTGQLPSAVEESLRVLGYIE